MDTDTPLPDNRPTDEPLPARNGKGLIVKRGPDGRIAKGNQPANMIGVAADPRTMAAARWEKYRRAAAARVQKYAASIDPTVTTPEDAAALLVERTYQQAMDAERPQPDALLAVQRSIGAMPLSANETRQDGNTPAINAANVTINLVMSDIAASLLQPDDSDVVDADTDDDTGAD